jgi:hypothetical protein
MGVLRASKPVKLCPLLGKFRLTGDRVTGSTWKEAGADALIFSPSGVSA